MKLKDDRLHCPGAVRTTWGKEKDPVIIQKQKPFEEILEELEGDKKIFIAGCTECATTCKTGGEEEVLAMKEKLEAKGKEITGSHIFDTACLAGEVRRRAEEHKEALERSDSVLVLACGTGVQTIGDQLDVVVHPGCDSLFLGEVVHLGKYQEKCSTCGECILEYTGGICPVTRCPKGLLNGPCGGYTEEGKCEVDPEKDCAWVLIYNRLKERGKLEKLRTMQEPKHFSHTHTPRLYAWPKRRPEKKEVAKS